MLRQHLSAERVGGERLRHRRDAGRGVGDLELLHARRVVEGGVVRVEPIQRRRVGAHEDALPFVVEVQQAQVSLPALRQPLVVEQHRRHRALGHAVAVIVELIGPGVGVVVVTRADGEHVRVRRHDLVEHALRERPETAGGEHVLVQVDPHVTLGVLADHAVHPLDVLRVQLHLVDVVGPAHVEHEQVDAVGRDQVIVTAVVLVGAAVPGVVGEAGLAEDLAVLGVVGIATVHVVVACEHAVGHSRLVQHPVGGIRVLPLVLELGTVDDVAGVHEVLDVQVVTLGQHEVVDVELVLVERVRAPRTGCHALVAVVVLRVGLPCDGEVVLRSGRGVGVERLDARLPRAARRAREALRVLHEQGDDAIGRVAVHRHAGDQVECVLGICRERHRTVLHGQVLVDLLPRAIGRQRVHRDPCVGVRRARPRRAH